jgi:hypothetical protein
VETESKGAECQEGTYDEPAYVDGVLGQFGVRTRMVPDLECSETARWKGQSTRAGMHEPCWDHSSPVFPLLVVGSA